MTSPAIEHRLEGLEPDNVLAILGLLGLLRVLELARPDWRPRIAWSVDRPPVRPLLLLRTVAELAEIAAVAAEGVAELACDHAFEQSKLAFSPAQSRSALQGHADGDTQRQRETAALWSALMSDAAIRDGKEIVERTPFCLLDVAQTAFLKTLREIASAGATPKVGRKQVTIADTLEAALFHPWRRAGQTPSFRWDPEEDSRHALRWAAPTDDKQGVEHGANILAAFGLRSLTVVPRQRRGEVRLAMIGGEAGRGFSFGWPIWSLPLSLAAIEGLLSHPKLRQPEALAHLGVTEVRVAEKFNPSGGKYSNFGRGRPLHEEPSVPPAR